MSSQEQWKASQKARNGAELDVPWGGEFDNDTGLLAPSWVKDDSPPGSDVTVWRHPEGLDAVVYGPLPAEEPPLAVYDALYPGDDDGA